MATSQTVSTINFIQLEDKSTGMQFLVDTGAGLSLLPHKMPSSGPCLVGANGSAIKAWGFQNRTVTFGRNSCTFKFLLADIARPIIGFTFLRFHKLDLSVATGLVRFAATGTLGEPPPPPLIASANNQLSKVSPLVLAAIPDDVQALLVEFPAILSVEVEHPCPHALCDAPYQDYRPAHFLQSAQVRK